MKRKVRIKSLPPGYHMMPDGTIMKDDQHMAEGGSVRNTLSPIPRSAANLEAEKGEVAAVDFDGTGMLGLYKIGGKRHSKGGTPLSLPADSDHSPSFIFSDTPKMRIKDKEFLAKYGMQKPSTPAKLASKYLKRNENIETLNDKNSDLFEKVTSNHNIKNSDKALAEIAFMQEAMKGFPQGIPSIAASVAGDGMWLPEMTHAAYGGTLVKAANGGVGGSPELDLANAFNKNRKEFVKKFVAANKGNASLINALNSSTWNADPLAMAQKFKDNPTLVAALSAIVYPNGAPQAQQTRTTNTQDNLELKIASDFMAGNQGEIFSTLVRNAPPSLRPTIGMIFTGVGDDKYALADSLKDSPEVKEALANVLYNRQPTQTAQTATETSTNTSTNTRNRRSESSTSRRTPAKNQNEAINPEVLKVMMQLGMVPMAEDADYADPSRLLYEDVQKFVPGYKGVYEDALANAPGWAKRMEDLGYDLSAWKDAEGNLDLKSLKGRDPRVGAYQDWWNPKVEEWIAEQDQKRQDAGYPAFTPEEIAGLRTLKFSEPGDPNSQKGSFRDEKFGTYTSNRFLPQGEYEMQASTVYFCVDGEVFGQSVRPGYSADTPSGKDVKGPFKTQQEANQACASEPSIDITDTPEGEKSRTVPFKYDVRNLRTLVQNRLSERKRYPWAGRLDYINYDPVYPDDTRQQQQIAGRSRGMVDAIGQFAGPARQAATASVISGQAGEQAADVASTMGNQIVQIANEAAKINAQNRQSVNSSNLLLAQQQYNDAIKTDETFDEKMRRYRLYQTAAMNKLEENMYRAETYNKMNPLYQITPPKGEWYNTGHIEFMPGVSSAMFDPAYYSSQQKQQEEARRQRYEAAMASPYISEADKSSIAKEYYGFSAKSSARTNQQVPAPAQEQVPYILDPNAMQAMGYAVPDVPYAFEQNKYGGTPKSKFGYKRKR